MNEIYQACVDAGSSVCPLYESSADKVSARVDKLLVALKAQPVSFYNATTGEYGILDYSAAKASILESLSAPYRDGATLLSALAAAEQGEVQPLYDIATGSTTGSLFECPATEAPITFASGIENQYSVRCGDTARPPYSLDEFKEIYAEMAQDSQFFSESWAFNLGCA